MTHYGIIGLGPIGGVLAVALQKAGQKVTVYCRNYHKAEYLRTRPLKISGKFHAEETISGIVSEFSQFVGAKPEVVLICTKSTHSFDILKMLKTAGIGENTHFVSCQNGIDVEEQITQVYGTDKALRLVLNLGANFINRQEIMVSFLRPSILSEAERFKGTDKSLAQFLDGVGFNVRLSANYKFEAFKKAMLNTALGSVCSLTRMTMRQVMEDPVLVRMVRQILIESMKVGEGIGYQFEPGFLEIALGYLAGGGDHKPSILIDIENARETENEDNAGKLFGYAQANGVDVPVIQTLYYLCKGLESSVVLDSYVSKQIKGYEA